MQTTHPHPEWKRLLEELAPGLEVGRLYSYEELEEAAGVDIQSPRGRQQFLRFAREVLGTYKLHFENERDKGYRIVPAKDHGLCSASRVRKAGRQIRWAKKIAENTRFEDLTKDELRGMTDLTARLGRLYQSFVPQRREIKKLAVAVQTGRLPHPMRQLEIASGD